MGEQVTVQFLGADGWAEVCGFACPGGDSQEPPKALSASLEAASLV